MPDALIWGASSAMAQALIAELNQRGDWRIFAAARDVSKIPAMVTDDFEFDASSEHSFQQVMMFVGQQTQELDLVVYFAGSLAYEKLDRMALGDWMQTLDSNLNGAFLAAHHSLPLLRQGGHMIFIGAYIDHIRLPKMGAYAVAKAGLEELFNLLARENRRKNFTLVRPGAVDTPFWEQVSFSKPDDAKAPEVVAQAILTQYESDGAGLLDL